MADKTPIKSMKEEKKAAAKRVAAKAAKPRMSHAKSSARKPANAAVMELPAHCAVPQATATNRKGPAVAAKPTLLTGGNPQIAKGDGDAPVQDYIAAMPGWRSDVGRRLDALIVRTFPRCAQGGQMELTAVRGGGPRLVPRHPLLYELRQGGFLPRHVAASCPPGESKSDDTRYLNIHEDDQLDEAQLAA